MKTKKLLKALDDLFDRKAGKRRKHRDELEVLLAGLREKRDQVENRIRDEKGGRERERLERKLAIIKAQIEKGTETLRVIEAELGES